MTDAAKVSSELRNLASHTWLSDRARHLRELAVALEDTAPDNPWLEIDIVATLGDDRTLSGAEPRRPWYAHEALTGVLVFLPILITWHGLWRASQAYQAMLAEAPQTVAGRTFLELWQAGFDGRLGAWTAFGGLAATTLLAVFLVTTAALVSLLARKRLDDVYGRRRADLLTRLRRALLDAQLLMARHRRSLGAEGGLGDLIAQARKTQTQAQRALSIAAKQAETLAEASAGLGPAADRIAVAVEALASSAQLIRRQTVKMESALTNLPKQTQEASARLIETIATSLSRSIRRLDATLSELASGHQGFSSDMSAAADASGRAVQEVQEVARLLGVIAERLQALPLGDHGISATSPQDRELVRRA